MLDHPLLKGRPVIQNCWVVPSIEEAVEKWVKVFGVGRWLLMENDPGVKRYYRGKETDARYRAALADWGNIQVELIDSLQGGPSAFADMAREGETVFHHVAIESADFDADVKHFEGLGCPLAYMSTYGNMHYGIVDTREALGFMVELLERSEAHEGAVSYVRSLSEGFDGSNPLVRAG